MSRATDPTLNTVLPEDTREYGKLQRLRFIVPKPASTLLLGQRWTEDPAFGYSGASLRVDANLFLDVGARTLVQGHQAMTFQTAEAWTQYSTGPTVVYARANVDVTSAAGVIISAVDARRRDPLPGADMKPVHGEEVPVVASYVDVRDALLDAERDALATWGDVAGTVGSVKDQLGSAFAASEVTDRSTHASDVAASMRSTADSTTHGATHAGLGLVSQDPLALLTPERIVGVAGAGINLIAGTQDTASDVTALASGAVTVRAAKRAELFGGTGVAVEGQTAQLTGVGAVAVSSRQAPASVLAPAIYVGAEHPDDRLGPFAGCDASKQLPTESVAVAATKTVTTTAGETARIESRDVVEIVAQNKATISVGAFKIVIEGSVMKIGQIDGQTTVTIQNENVVIKAGPTQTVTVDKSAGITVKSGGTKITVGADGVALSGPAVKLG
jgi:hypothetical protein